MMYDMAVYSTLKGADPLLSDFGRHHLQDRSFCWYVTFAMADPEQCSILFYAGTAQKRNGRFAKHPDFGAGGICGRQYC